MEFLTAIWEIIKAFAAYLTPEVISHLLDIFAFILITPEFLREETRNQLGHLFGCVADRILSIYGDRRTKWIANIASVPVWLLIIVALPSSLNFSSLSDLSGQLQDYLIKDFIFRIYSAIYPFLFLAYQIVYWFFYAYKRYDQRFGLYIGVILFVLARIFGMYHSIHETYIERLTWISHPRAGQGGEHGHQRAFQ